MEIFLDDFKADFHLTFKPIEKKGDTYLSIDTFDWDFSTSKLHLSFTNLIHKNKALGEYYNNIIIYCNIITSIDIRI